MGEASEELPNDLAEYRGYLRFLARRGIPARVRGKVDESDLVQETLFEAHRMSNSFQGKTSGQYLAWLRKILSNKICDIHRHYSRGKRDVSRERTIHESIEHSSQCLEKSLAAGDTSVSDKAARKEEILLIVEALSRMPENQCKVIELHYFEGKSFSEVAAAMDMTRNQVAGLIRRALEKLRAVNSINGDDHDG